MVKANRCCIKYFYSSFLVFATYYMGDALEHCFVQLIVETCLCLPHTHTRTQIDSSEMATCPTYAVRHRFARFARLLRAQRCIMPRRVLRAHALCWDAAGRRLPSSCHARAHSRCAFARAWRLRAARLLAASFCCHGRATSLLCARCAQLA